MLLDNLYVILHKPRFPENIGMAARALANMGCPNLTLVQPERFVREKADPLATCKGLPILDQVHLSQSLSDATKDCTAIFGTTARRGGFRKNWYTPKTAAPYIAEKLLHAEKVALVFGSEDRGLTNEEICGCHHLISIPTDQATSLNLAQAVLLILYECAEALRSCGKKREQQCTTITAGELERFLSEFKDILLAIDSLHGDNSKYFFLPWQHFFARSAMTPKEYAAFMGFCHQLKRFLPPNCKHP